MAFQPETKEIPLPNDVIVEQLPSGLWNSRSFNLEHLYSGTNRSAARKLASEYAERLGTRVFTKRKDGTLVLWDKDNLHLLSQSKKG